MIGKLYLILTTLMTVLVLLSFWGVLLTAVDWYRSDARMVPRWAVEWYHLGRTDSTAMIRADIEVPTPPAFFRPVVLSGLMIVMAVRKAFCR